ncbi:MAG TPA: TIM barrel protein [Sphingobium sp.]|uniref:sugar phosphate isomerase/epimerase family protein n=1 Tax=Sphingobium sp. TaxID=1912891 RepID=UPI002ED259EE
MVQISLDSISTLGMPPYGHVELAERLGCSHLCLSVAPIVHLPELYPQWSLRDDPSAVREVKAALALSGLRVLAGEGFFIAPCHDVEGLGQDFDIMAELQAARLTVYSLEPDRSRALDQLAIMAEMAAARGMGVNLEFVPTLAIADLRSALSAASYIGRDDFGLVLDAMHIFRSGATEIDVAAIDPGLIGHVQLCDVSLTHDPAHYGFEASFERLQPGEGELPLTAFLRALPDDRPIGLEIPMRSRALSGEDAYDRLRPCVEAAIALAAAARNA